MTTCPVCGKQLKNRGTLGSHVRRMHGTTLKELGVAKAPGRKVGVSPKPKPKPKPRPKTPVGVDVMLEHMFPQGIPTGKIAKVLEWVDLTKELTE